MEYPHTLHFNVEKIFGNQEVQITLYSGLTILVGTNASGKTQTLKKIRDIMKRELGSNKVRYLSSNRIVGAYKGIKGRRWINYSNGLA